MGEGAKESITPISELLLERDESLMGSSLTLHEAVLLALYQFGPIAKNAIQPVLRVLNDPETPPKVKVRAAHALGAIGYRTDSVVAALDACRRSKDRALAHAAEEAYGKVCR